MKSVVKQAVTNKLRNGEPEHKLTQTSEFFESSTQGLPLSAFGNFSFEEVQFIRFLSKLWTIALTALEQTCTLCLINFMNQFQHVVFGCSFTCYIRNSFYDSLINSFDVHLYLELTHLNEDTLFYILFVGIETTTVLEEHEKKDVI